MKLNEQFSNRIKNAFENGEEWLANLPKLITDCEAKFQIQVLEPVEDLSYNYVAYATTEEGQDCILKLGYVEKVIARECEALKEMESPSIVKLLNQDNTLCAMLLERLTPGNTLAKTPEMEANEVCAQIIENIVKPYDGTPQGRFTTTAFANNTQCLAFLQFEAYIINYTNNLPIHATISYG